MKSITKQLLSLFIIAISFSSCGNTSQQAATASVDPSPKQIQPWVICKENASFSEIAPYKDMLTNISVFGKPSKEFIDQCHANNIEVYHAVGGKATQVDTPEERSALVQHYVDVCQKQNFDGIDLDFEHLPAEAQSFYTEFLQLASNELHAINKKLSHCVGYHPVMFDNPNAKIFCDPVVLNQTCDLVRVMCYDMFFGPGVGKEEFANRYDCSGVGATSNYLWTKRCMQQWSRHIAKEKLVMALPAYGNDYSLGSEGLTGRQIYACVPDSAKSLPAPKWLYDQKLNLYVYDGLDGNKHLFYASDAQSTEILLQLADELGIKRVGFWHYASVSQEMWEVTRKWMKQ